jgi:hypothetical protein
MPKLTSKMTVKIEPELQRRIQLLAETKETSVSNYVRKALIDHVRDVEEENSPSTLRLKLTMMERHVMTQLIRIGAITDPEEMFHKSFDSYISSDLERIMTFTNRLKDMREFPSTIPLTTRRKAGSIFEDLMEEDDLDAETEKKGVDDTGSG